MSQYLSLAKRHPRHALVALVLRDSKRYEGVLYEELCGSDLLGGLNALDFSVI